MIRYDFDFKDQQTYIKALIEDLKSLIIWSPVLKDSSILQQQLIVVSVVDQVEYLRNAFNACVDQKS